VAAATYIAPLKSGLELGSFVARRRYGATEVAVVRSGVMYWQPQFPPGAEWQDGVAFDTAGRAALDINGIVARTADAVVAVDPNSFAAPDDVATPAPVDAALAALGLDAGDVTHVLVTHGHRDHFTGVLAPGDEDRLRFPTAEHFFPAADMPAGGVTGRHIDDVRHVMGVVGAQGRLRLTSGDVEVTDDVWLLAAPGETPGHQVVRVTCDDTSLYYLADLVHFTAEVAHLDWVGHPCDTALLAASRRRVFADPGSSPATFLFAHSPFPGWGTITPVGGEGWQWRYD
jgi:glyoxylase-like metal-dependent hydrolase (beta-lactamase superfamily II)